MNKQFLLSKNIITGKVLDERLVQLLETIKKEGIVVHVDREGKERSIEAGSSNRIEQLERIVEQQQERISELEKKVFGKEQSQQGPGSIPKAPKPPNAPLGEESKPWQGRTRKPTEPPKEEQIPIKERLKKELEDKRGAKRKKVPDWHEWTEGIGNAKKTVRKYGYWELGQSGEREFIEVSK